MPSRSPPETWLVNRHPCYTVVRLVVVASEQALFVGLSVGAIAPIQPPRLAFDYMLGCGVEDSSCTHALAVDNLYLYIVHVMTQSYSAGT